MFTCEDEMTVEFERVLKGLFSRNEVVVLKQLRGVVGIPDFVLLDNGPRSRIIVAIELKMTNWRRALLQAYKYRTFSHLSIVLMDAAGSKSALKHLDSFAKYKIGLATLDYSRRMKVYSLPEPLPPLSMPIHKMFRDRIGAEGCDIKNNRRTSLIQTKLLACIET